MIEDLSGKNLMRNQNSIRNENKIIIFHWECEEDKRQKKICLGTVRRHGGAIRMLEQELLAFNNLLSSASLSSHGLTSDNIEIIIESCAGLGQKMKSSPKPFPIGSGITFLSFAMFSYKDCFSFSCNSTEEEILLSHRKCQISHELSSVWYSHGCA